MLNRNFVQGLNSSKHLPLQTTLTLVGGLLLIFTLQPKFAFSCHFGLGEGGIDSTKLLTIQLNAALTYIPVFAGGIGPQNHPVAIPCGSILHRNIGQVESLESPHFSDNAAHSCVAFSVRRDGISSIFILLQLIAIPSCIAILVQPDNSTKFFQLRTITSEHWSMGYNSSKLLHLQTAPAHSYIRTLFRGEISKKSTNSSRLEHTLTSHFSKS